MDTLNNPLGLMPIPTAEELAWGRWAAIMGILEKSSGKAYGIKPPLTMVEKYSLRSAARWRGYALHIQPMPNRKTPEYSLVWIKGTVAAPVRRRVVKK